MAASNGASEIIKAWIGSGFYGGICGAFACATLVDAAGDADGVGTAGVGVGDGVGVGVCAGASVVVGLAITSLSLLMGEGGEEWCYCYRKNCHTLEQICYRTYAM